MTKTVEEINKKIRNRKAVVVTAEEMASVVKKDGAEKASEKVDVVTTGTFGPMCSSGVFLNFGQSKPKIKMHKVYLNDVEAYSGLAAVDAYLGATQMSRGDSLNRIKPGRFSYGGGHVIEDLISGKKIKIKASAYGTDCYPRLSYDGEIRLKDINEAIMCSPRNAYQNYNCAVNVSDKTVYTYMGILKPHLGNANYCSAGQLSPLLNDPEYRTIGPGTRIFLGGARGYVSWNGTQHNPGVQRGANGVPCKPAGTLMVTGNLKEMSPEWIKGASMTGYGASLIVAVGVPVPVLDEKIAAFCGVSDEDIYCPIVDYSKDYPQGTGRTLGKVSYAELRRGEIKVKGKTVPAASLSSYYKAREIAEKVKEWVEEGSFLLGRAQETLPGPSSNISFKSLPPDSGRGK